MHINLNFESDEPIYTQLVQQIIAGIAKGDLQPSERLPSVRALAADIGINLHTVNKSYQQLRQDGYILIHRQRGVVINPDGPAPADDAYREQMKKQLYPIIAEAICKSMDEKDFLSICSTIYKEFKDGEGK